MNYTANASDDLQLSFCQFIENQSLSDGAKIYINKSLSGTSDQCSQNYSIRLVAYNVINFTVIVNDSVGNLNQSSQIIEVADLTNPIVNATINNSAPKYNQIVNYTANVSDDIGLSYCQIIINQTGAKQFFNTSLIGIAAQCSQNFTISLAGRGVINFSVIVNDSSNNFKTNDTIITVVNSPPLVATFQPSNSSPQFNFTLNLTFNVTGSDADGDLITFDWYINKTHNLSNRNLSLIFNNTGVYNVSVVLSDGTDNLTQQWQVTITNDTQEGSGGGGSGSSGGGGGGSSGGGGGGGGSSGGGGGGGAPDNTIASFFFQEIKQNSKTVIRVSVTSSISLFRVSFFVNTDLKDVSIDIKAYNASSAPYTIDGNVYQYAEIKHVNLKNTDVFGVVTEFKVLKSWLNAHGLDPATIKLWRYDSAWNELKASKVSEDTEFIYYSADSPGLSLFAISFYKLRQQNVSMVANEIVAEATAEVVKEPSVEMPTQVEQPKLAEQCGNYVCKGFEWIKCPKDCYKFNVKISQFNLPHLKWKLTLSTTLMMLLAFIISEHTWIYVKGPRRKRRSEEEPSSKSLESIGKQIYEIKKIQQSIREEKHRQSQLKANANNEQYHVQSVAIGKKEVAKVKQPVEDKQQSKSAKLAEKVEPEQSAGFLSKFFKPRSAEEIIDEKKTKLLSKYGLEYGALFLFSDKDEGKSINAFKTLVSVYPGIAVVRNNPQKSGIDNKYAQLLWLTESEGKNCIRPSDVEEVFYVIEKFVKKNSECVVLVQGIELIKRATNFKTISRLLKDVKDEISSKNVVVIVPFNQDTLSKDEAEQLKSEFKII